MSYINGEDVMPDINIKGNKNISNTGVIQGDCIIDSTIIYLPESSLLNLLKTFSMGDSEKEQSLVNMTDAQKKLADAIDKFAQAELIRAEADKLRAKADENNSLANLNYSKIMLEDREIIKVMLEKLK